MPDMTGSLIIEPDRSTLVEHNFSVGHGIHNIAAGQLFKLLMSIFNATISTVMEGQIVARIIPGPATILVADPPVTDFPGVTPVKNMDGHLGPPSLRSHQIMKIFWGGGGEKNSAWF